MEIQFIEPCCAGRQLPSLLREQSVASFQTNGDVTFEHIIKAVSCLAGDELSVILMVPSVNVDMLRVLAWFGRRGWLKKLHVVTTENQSGLVYNETSGEVPTVLCSHHERVAESLLVISGEKKCVVVNGQFLTSVVPGHRFYTAAVGAETSDAIRMFTATMTTLMRNVDATPVVEVVSDQQESIEADTEDASALNEDAAETEIVPENETAPSSNKKSRKK